MVINKNKAFLLPAGSGSFENPSGGDFGKILEDFGRKILPKSCKMLINLDLGRLRALKNLFKSAQGSPGSNQGF